MKLRKIKYIATVHRWFDRVNGNTYHSVRIIRSSDGKTIACQFQYGYGEQYKSTALTAMLSEKWLPKQYDSESIWSYERENNYPILWNVSDGLKRDCVKNGRME